MTFISSSLRFLTPHGIRPQLPLLVILPGMDGTGELYTHQCMKLEAAFDIRCLTLPVDDLSPWDALVGQLLALIHREPKHRPFYLCGESFGGCLALKLIAVAPTLVDRLILINPATSFSRLPWMQWASALTSWITPSTYQFSGWGALPFLAAQHRVSLKNQQALLKAMQSVSQRSVAWRLNLLNQFRLEALPLETYRNPVLVVAGQDDRLLPSLQEADRLVARFPVAQKYVLPSSGHAALLETEVDLYKIIKATHFLPIAPTASCR